MSDKVRLPKDVSDNVVAVVALVLCIVLTIALCVFYVFTPQ